MVFVVSPRNQSETGEIEIAKQYAGEQLTEDRGLAESFGEIATELGGGEDDRKGEHQLGTAVVGCLHRGFEEGQHGGQRYPRR